MKKLLFFAMLFAVTTNIKAQDVTVAEPEFVNSYCILTSESSYDVLPKKDRRIQWTQFEPALLGSEKAQKAGYVTFEGHKYGEQSYLLTIPASEVKSGEYGIFYMSIISASVIPVGTFSVK